MDEKQVTVVQDDFMPMELSAMADRLAYVEEFCKKILKPGADFGVIPGTNKPTIYKPGVEKLAFAFNLEARYSIVSKIEEPFRDWDYEYTVKQTGEVVKKTAKGYFKFTVLCELFNRSTGERWGSQLADCDSLERGRETSPSNTVMKMAEKRAYVGAVLNATFTSDRFTQDIEDYKGDQSVGGKRENSFPAKYDTWCTVCGKKHPAETMVVKHGTNSKGKPGYASVECIANANKEDSIDRSEGKEPESLVGRVQELEALWREVDATDAEIASARFNKTGKKTLPEMNHAQCKNYIEFLEGLGIELE